MPTDIEQLIEEDRRSLGDQVPDQLLDQMFTELAGATLDRSPGPRDRLRELSTPIRIALASASMLAVCAVVQVLGGLRTDLGGDDLLQFVVSFTATTALSVGAVALALRGAHHRPLGNRAWVWAAVFLGLPFVLATVPGMWPGMVVPHDALHAHLGCALMGMVGAIPAAFLVLLFERSDEPVVWRLLMAAGAGGLAGFAFQNAHCPASDSYHLLVSHAPYGLALAGLLLGVSAISRRVR